MLSFLSRISFVWYEVLLTSSYRFKGFFGSLSVNAVAALLLC